MLASAAVAALELARALVPAGLALVARRDAGGQSELAAFVLSTMDECCN